VAHELVYVGIQDNERQYVIRYSGNEVFKDHMITAFQVKWNQKLEKNRAACKIRNLNKEDLITENGERFENAEFGHSQDQEIAQQEDLDTGFWSESTIKLGRNAHLFALSSSP
jgi:predicted enzyme involved in methoxymalonyl-ACP biosynthesis